MAMNQGVVGMPPISYADLLKRGIGYHNVSPRLLNDLADLENSCDGVPANLQESKLKNFSPLAREVAARINVLLRANDKSGHRDEALPGQASPQIDFPSPRVRAGFLQISLNIAGVCSNTPAWVVGLMLAGPPGSSPHKESVWMVLTSFGRNQRGVGSLCGTALWSGGAEVGLRLIEWTVVGSIFWSTVLPDIAAWLRMLKVGPRPILKVSLCCCCNVWGGCSNSRTDLVPLCGLREVTPRGWWVSLLVLMFGQHLVRTFVVARSVLDFQFAGLRVLDIADRWVLPEGAAIADIFFGRCNGVSSLRGLGLSFRVLPLNTRGLVPRCLCCLGD
ncbi:hypothetical protein Nepgr_030925 [Nepenthes gracilis]|uniref:Uncharacterized protein n=1 Tax=Nepenthes gracilis TaxID=150966 RepID=A0AAD3Y4B8_NEPGR|nr:hypothetical protein Nepgr_030925 [Nepenthes gracilis]